MTPKSKEAIIAEGVDSDFWAKIEGYQRVAIARAATIGVTAVMTANGYPGTFSMSVEDIHEIELAIVTILCKRGGIAEIPAVYEMYPAEPPKT